MSQDRQMLVSVALIVDIDHDDADAALERSSRVGDLLRDAARTIAAQEADCQATDVIAYHYLGLEWENAARCHSCGSWATDPKKTNDIDGLAAGFWMDGSFLCIDCRPDKESSPAVS